jgi:hypothetical protein
MPEIVSMIVASIAMETRDMGGLKTLGLGVLAVFASASVISTAAWAQPPMQEGNWEVIIKMEMVGMPMQLPAQTQNQCVTKKDLVPDMSDKEQQCIVREQKVTGDTVSWKMECTSKDGKMNGEGRIKYAGKSYAGDMQMTMTRTGMPKPMTMTVNMQGKHTGACKADSRKAKRADDY